MTIRGAVLLADKQMPVTKRIVNTSNLPALDNLEWVNVGHPLLVSNELQHPPKRVLRVRPTQHGSHQQATDVHSRSGKNYVPTQERGNDKTTNLQ